MFCLHKYEFIKMMLVFRMISQMEILVVSPHLVKNLHKIVDERVSKPENEDNYHGKIFKSPCCCCLKTL